MCNSVMKQYSHWQDMRNLIVFHATAILMWLAVIWTEGWTLWSLETLGIRDQDPKWLHILWTTSLDSSFYQFKTQPQLPLSDRKRKAKAYESRHPVNEYQERSLAKDDNAHAASGSRQQIRVAHLWISGCSNVWWEVACLFSLIFSMLNTHI